MNQTRFPSIYLDLSVIYTVIVLVTGTCNFNLMHIFLPLGPRILTVSCPAPAPRVSQMNLDWYMARTPCSTPGPYTLTRVGSGAPETLTV